MFGSCLAGIYIPVDEDFGLVPVELMAAGKPVIGVDEGGLKETIIDGETGILLPSNPKLEDLSLAVSQLESENTSSQRKICQDRAKLFTMDKFITKMQELL